ncbi:MAG: prephenate dehydrogenase [Planctomycetaceae bacterium]|jgi:prephenate dehydrogenase|nr:prephenate dehydrogenase [Planctomycetaceae bacterium]
MNEAATPPDPAIQTLAIVGVGLIGGSIAAAARQRQVVSRVIGIGRSQSRLEDAARAGLIDEGSTDFAAAASAELSIVCTPVDRIANDVRSLAAVVPRESLLTDAGSTKRLLCEELADLDGQQGPVFLGSHPLAGSERQGFENANADLFVDRVCVLTPLETTPAASLAKLETFWQSLGARVVQRSPIDHDRGLAHTSHLPHLLAAALAGMLAENEKELAATGFRDTTRIAAGDPGLWVPILRHNATAVIEALATLDGRLEKFSRSLEQDDTETLQKLLEEAKRKREGLG